MYNVYHIFGELRQFLLIITMTPEVLLSKLQLYASSFLFTRRFYKVFGRYLLYCVRIGLDWIHILGHQLDWTGLGSVARGFGLDWIVSTRSIPHSGSRVGQLFLIPCTGSDFVVFAHRPSPFLRPE